MTAKNTISQFWESKFPGCPPVGYYLRDVFPNRWVRFHSLPDSQRYPNDESEMVTVLSRHNTIIGELAADENLILLSTGYSSSSEPVSSELIEHGLFPKSTHWVSVAMHEIDLESYGPTPNYWHIYQEIVEWQAGVFDSVFKLVAQDEIANIIICSVSGGWLYHPYDGGADVILLSEAQRDEIKGQHKDWLSPHPEGL